MLQVWINKYGKLGQLASDQARTKKGISCWFLEVEGGGKRVKVCVTRMKAERGIESERGQYATVTRLN